MNKTINITGLRRSLCLLLTACMMVLPALRSDADTSGGNQYGIGEGYDPESPGDPVTPPTPPKTYKITILSNPVGAGYTSYSSGNYEEGYEISMYAYENSGFRFTDWTIDGETYSTDRSIRFTVPAREVEIVANFVYDPASPGDPNPSEQRVKHPVTLRCEPAGTASFNYTDSFSLEEGETIGIYVYPSEGWEPVSRRVNGVEEELTSAYMPVTMGEKAIDVVYTMRYNPVSPGNPGSNYYNSQTGELVIDDFPTGRFRDTFYNLLGGYNYNGVTSVVVKGVMDREDAGWVGVFEQASTVDLSRVGGLTQLRGLSFNSQNLEHLYLPSCLEEIVNNALYDVPNLQSITLYAPVPPTVYYYSFNGITDRSNCILYVPAESVPLYSEAEIWKDFVILPISSNAFVMQVNLPEEASDGRYKHNIIQIANVNTGIKQKYVVSDRLFYTFGGLQKDEVYNVYMFSQSGLELGCIENVVIPDGDFEVSFDSLKSLYTVTSKVTDPEGEDVTDRVTVEWYKALSDGTSTYLRKGATLPEVPEGEELLCKLTLDNYLGSRYLQPADSRLTVGDETRECVIALQPFAQVNLSGKVVDSDGNAINGATVSASQMLNGRFPKTVATKTDRKGAWEMSVNDVEETRLTYSAPECVNATDTLAAFTGPATDLGTRRLRSIVGARVNYSMTYCEAGEEPTPYINENRDLTVSVHNVTQDRPHNEVSLQYPVIAVLDENIAEGDELKLTLSSRSGAFKPIEKKVVIDGNQRAQVTFDIVGKGGIAVRYSESDNAAVTAMLYNEKGELVKSQDYADATAKFTGLDDGTYTLVSIGKSDLMNAIGRLSGFEQTGLTEGEDYAKSDVTVETGRLTPVTVETVPVFDESLFYYTTPSSGFTSNKSEITSGNYLTLRANLEFKEAYKDAVEDVTLVVEFPESTDFVENSVITGITQAPYTYENHRLTVNLGSKYRDQVRFCVIPTEGGEYQATATVTFETGGRTVSQPLGTALAKIKNLEINVPSLTASLSFMAAGTAPAKSDVEVVCDGAVIGTAKANNAGRWSAECTLTEATKLGSVFVQAKVTTPDGRNLVSDESEIQYDPEAILPSEVVMTFYNGWYKRQYEVTWDLLEAKCSTNKYDFYTTTDMTFLVKFTSNDPARLNNIVLNVFTSDGRVRKLVPVYSETHLCWVATDKFSNNALPTNVSVDYAMTEPRKFDNDVMTEYLNLSEIIKQLYGETAAWLEEMKQRYDNATDEEKRAILHELLAECGIVIPRDAVEELSEAEIREHLDAMEEDPDWLGNLLAANPFGADLSEYMEGVSFTRCDGITAESLEAEGYTAIPKSDGTSSYFLLDGTQFIFVDLDNDARMTVDLNANSVLARSLRGIRAVDADKGWLNDIKELAEKIKTTVQSVYDFFNECQDRIGRLVMEYGDEITMLERDLTWLENTNGSWFLKTEVEFKLFLKGQAMKGLESLREWLNSNVKEWMQGNTKASKIAGKAFSFAGLILDGVEAYNNMVKLYDLRDSIEPPCEKAKQCAEGLRQAANDWIRGSGAYYTYKLGADIAELIGMGSAISALIPSGGTSATVILASAAVVAINIAADLVYSNSLENFLDSTKKKVEKMKELCKKEDSKPEDFPRPDKDLPNDDNSGTNPNHYKNPTPPVCDPVNPILDPSGYVYEAVPENRVEGVQATIYYKETKEDMYGDPYEEIVLWNAEEYAQKNPLFTDEYGMYQWDVPQGLWQVKFEKDGYVTAYSEWLPVPPPQLDVNVGITQNKQPEVIDARAYEEGIEVKFDKYMDPATLTASNIFVTAGDSKLSGEIRLLDSALADTTADAEDLGAVRYASGVRFVPERPLSDAIGEIILTVRRNVSSYAGIPMTETFTQTLDVEKEVQAIAAEDVKVLQGAEREITVFVLPAEAAAGRTLRIANSSDLILSVDKQEAIVDEEGKAIVTVKGLVPGNAMLTFTIDDVDVTGECLVEVVTELLGIEPPKASRASGTSVYRGSTVELTADSEDAQIYYTLDGSCPCDAAGTRILYTAPIVINDDVEIQAMAVLGDSESDVASFTFTVKRNEMTLTLEEGWTWISHTYDAAVSAQTLFDDAAVAGVYGATGELRRDGELGLTGTLKALEPAHGYKVQTTASGASLNLSGATRNPGEAVSVARGWNWLGYPLTQTQTLDKAFASTEVETLDVVVGQRGFAQYDGERWIGTLDYMVPGEGYLYLSGSDKEIRYGGASSASAIRGITPRGAAPDYAVDIHRYPSVMPVVATLVDEEGNPVDNSSLSVTAFSGSECRGTGRVVNGQVHVSVYGNPGDKITFRMYDADTELDYHDPAAIDFREDMIGDIYEPHTLRTIGGSGVDDLVADGNVRVNVTDGMIRIEGIDRNDIDFVEVYDTDGRKMMRVTAIPESGICTESLVEGIYVVTVSGNGSYYYQKIIL